MTRGGSQQGLRDRGRTPMRWDAIPGGGFTGAAVTPWLPIGPAAVNVADQRDDPASVLALCQRLVLLRRAELAGAVSSYRRIDAGPGVWAYHAGPLVVVANLSASPVPLAGEVGTILLRTGPDAAMLGPWEGVIARPAG
jgi:glycosidase